MFDDQFKKSNSFWTVEEKVSATLHTIIHIAYLRQVTSFADYKVEAVIGKGVVICHPIGVL